MEVSGVRRLRWQLPLAARRVKRPTVASSGESFASKSNATEAAEKVKAMPVVRALRRSIPDRRRRREPMAGSWPRAP